MGNAAIYYYPSGTGRLHELDLGAPLSSLAHYPVRDMDTAIAFSGATSSVIFSAYENVQVRMDLIKSDAVVAELQAFVNYAARGGLFSLVEDTDYVFAGYCHYLPAPGDTRLELIANQFSEFSTVPLTGAGDTLILRGPSPRYLLERPSISLRSGTDVTLSTPIVFDWTAERWLLVRDPRFWPYLQVRPGSESSQMLRPDTRRLTYTLDLPLFEPPSAFDAAAELPADQVWPGEIVISGETFPGEIGGLDGFGQLGRPTLDLDRATPFGGV